MRLLESGTSTPRRRHLPMLMAAWLLAAVATTDAAAQPYPSKPIRLIVPFAAGGPSDAVARMIAEKLGAALRQSVVVDNRGGAGGVLGTDAVAKASPDGYTLGLATASTHEFSPACNRNSPYHPVKDFAMVGIIATTPSFLFVKADSPFASLKDVLAASRKEPGKITWGTPGVCSNTHFLIEIVNQAGNGKIMPVPYRGNSAAGNDLISGQLTLGSDAVTPSSVGFVKSGAIRPIAMTSSSEIDVLRNVPTYAQQGIDIGHFTIWQGLVAPANTPPDVLRKLNEALRQALADRDLRARWREAGIAPSTDSSPERMLRHVRDGFESSRKLAQELGVSSN